MSRQYTFPQVTIQQDFALIPAAATQELLACIVGPNKKVITMTDDDDAQYRIYGDYSPYLDRTYPIKGLDSTESLEIPSAKIILQKALLKYAHIDIQTEAMEVGPTNNIITINTKKADDNLGMDNEQGFFRFDAGRTVYNRFVMLKNRDVKVGDKLLVQADGRTMVEDVAVALNGTIFTRELHGLTSGDFVRFTDLNIGIEIVGGAYTTCSKHYVKVLTPSTFELYLDSEFNYVLTSRVAKLPIEAGDFVTGVHMQVNVVEGVVRAYPDANQLDYSKIAVENVEVALNGSTFTKVAHGLIDGDVVKFTTGTNGIGDGIDIVGIGYNQYLPLYVNSTGADTFELYKAPYTGVAATDGPNLVTSPVVKTAANKVAIAVNSDQGDGWLNNGDKLTILNNGGISALKVKQTYFVSNVIEDGRASNTVRLSTTPNGEWLDFDAASPRNIVVEVNVNRVVLDTRVLELLHDIFPPQIKGDAIWHSSGVNSPKVLQVIGLKDVLATANSSTFTFATGHGLTDGAMVRFTSPGDGESITGISRYGNGTYHYVKVLTPNTFELYANADLATGKITSLVSKTNENNVVLEVKTNYARLSILDVPEFIGNTDITYQIRVVKGGTWNEEPRIIVDTDTGADGMSPRAIKAENGIFDLGTLGLEGRFIMGGELKLGEVYSFTIEPRKKGPARTIRMSDSLLDQVASGQSVDVTFMIQKDELEIPAKNYPVYGDTNWAIDEDFKNEIKTEASWRALEPSWVDNLGNQLPLDIVGGRINLTYLALIKTMSNRLESFSSYESINARLGDIVPENKLAYGVYKAFLNSGGKTVFAVAVETDDLEGYITALAVTEGEVKVYYMVPLTSNEGIIQLFKGHVNTMSAPEKCMERFYFVHEAFSPVKSLYKLVSGTEDVMWKGYVEASSKRAGVYSVLVAPTATFLSDGLRVGDILQTNYGLNVFGDEISESLKIVNIIDEDHLEVEWPGFSDAVGSALDLKRFHIYRNLSKEEQAQSIAEKSAKLGDRRGANIWPDFLEDGDRLVPGYFGAAASAGLKSGMPPHQPLTNVQINGFTAINRASGYFTPFQLNRVAGGGTWIIDQVRATDTASAADAGSIVIRHQLTTDYSDDNHSEISITTNLDSISKWLRDDLEVIIGQYNNHPYVLNMIRTRVDDRLSYLQSMTVNLKAGPQIVSYKIMKVEVDKLIKTRVNIDVDLILPYPINNIHVKLTVVHELVQDAI